MAFLRPKTDPERAKQNAPKIARHRAWEIGAKGGAVLTKPYQRMHLALFAAIILDAFLRDQVLLIHGGYGDYILVMKLAALAAAIVAFWLGSAMWNSDVNFLVVAFAVISYAACIYLTVLYITYSTIPKVMTRFVTEPTVIETDHFAVHRRTRSNRGSLLYSLLGRGKKYCFMIAEQPILVSYVDDNHYEYTVTSSGTRLIEEKTIFFTGQANWFGIRVEAASNTSPFPGTDVVRIPLPADFDRMRDLPRSC